MARLKRSVVVEREQFLYDFFTNNRTADVNVANETLKSRFNGVAMAPSRVKDIRARVIHGLPLYDAPATATEPPATAVV